jgi:hypothetical protein
MGFELIKVGDDLYTVERKIPEHTGIDTNLFKGYTNTTNVFRRNNFSIYWAEPTISTQGTQNGKYKTSHN